MSSILERFIFFLNIDAYHYSYNTQQPPFYGHHTGQPALAGTSSYEVDDFVGAKFYCPHALADGNQRIRIMEKILEFLRKLRADFCLDLEKNPVKDLQSFSGRFINRFFGFK